MGLAIVILVRIEQFYIVISPISGTPSNQSDVATGFFQSCLALPVAVLFCIVWTAGTPDRSEITLGSRGQAADPCDV